MAAILLPVLLYYSHSMLSGEEVAKHASRESLWMIIKGQAYDLTEFAPEHPGGLKILLKYAGKDATEEYEPIHPEGTIEEALPQSKHLGPVDMTTVEKVIVEEAKAPIEGAQMSLGDCLNLEDFEKAAEQKLKPKAWAYYASAADDERTKRWNRESWNAVRLRPRVLVDVTAADISTTILGLPSAVPFFIAPAAMGRLAHPDGERCLARVAGVAEMPYMVSANASVSFEELAASATPSQVLFYQLYVNQVREKSEAQLKKVVAAGYKAICVTVDAPVAGKRERDERAKMDSDSAADASMKSAVTQSQGIAQSLGSYVDPSLVWDDLKWVRKVTGLPVIVKGIQTAEDAALCAQHGVDAIYLSNHGGRQLEGAPSSIETLLEIRKYEPQVLSKCEIYVDGGVRRGTDILKALALGAKAVGIGRPYMCSLAFGDDGVAAVTSILRDEVASNLRLLGATKLAELRPDMVNTRPLDQFIYGDYKQSTLRRIVGKL